MKTQATRLTRKEARFWDHWTAKGHHFQPGEKPPLTTQVAPTHTIKRPIRDALLALTIIVGIFCLIAWWIAHAAKLI